jgi:hypothetical protein
MSSSSQSGEDQLSWTRRKHLDGSVNEASKTALLNAVQQRNHKMVEQLLDYGIPPSDPTLVMSALAVHDIDCLRLLLLLGADDNPIPSTKSLIPSSSRLPSCFSNMGLIPTYLISIVRAI